MRRPTRDQRSPQAARYQHWYKTQRWRKLRAEHLLRHPMCVMCIVTRTKATVADHIIPHRGDEALFWDPANLQSLCELHHQEKQRLELGGTVRRPIGRDGWPIV